VLSPPGKTETHALLGGSPAIDYIPEISCTVETDQRGVVRPQGELCDIGAFEAGPPDGESTDSEGTSQDVYFEHETVYATGSGFPPDTYVDVHVVTDTAWTDGLGILPDVSGFVETVLTDGEGNLGPAAVWPARTTVGEYDIVFDVNRNGQFDRGVDAVDDPNHPGFVVLPSPIGGEVAPAASVRLLLPLVGLVVTALATVGVVLGRRRPA
jgi:hypothetical protein